jgi:hypothetical protein
MTFTILYPLQLTLLITNSVRNVDPIDKNLTTLILYFISLLFYLFNLLTFPSFLFFGNSKITFTTKRNREIDCILNYEDCLKASKLFSELKKSHKNHNIEIQDENNNNNGYKKVSNFEDI